MERPEGMPAAAAARRPEAVAAMRTCVLAVFTLFLALCARLLGLPDLRTAAALALSIGLGSALVASMSQRPRLRVVWAELTVWIGAAFLIASAWNAFWAGVTVVTGIDLALGLLILLAGFGVARAARAAGASG